MLLRTKISLFQGDTRAKQEQGFTLIELLVVIIVIGILAAIALPSFLSQTNKARQTQAKIYIGAANRAQQAYRLENSIFSDSLSMLGIGISSSSYHQYTVSNVGTSGVFIGAQSKDTAGKSYAGAVQFVETDPNTAFYMQSIICEAKRVGETALTSAAIDNFDPANPVPGDLACTNGTRELR